MVPKRSEAFTHGAEHVLSLPARMTLLQRFMPGNAIFGFGYVATGHRKVSKFVAPVHA